MKLTPMLGVRDVARSLAFYGDVLGFRTTSTSLDDAGRLQWAQVARGEATLMFYLAEDPAGLGASATFVLDVPDVAALHATAASAGSNPSPLRVAWYGRREFDLHDPDGYHLLPSEPMAEPTGDGG